MRLDKIDLSPAPWLHDVAFQMLKRGPERRQVVESAADIPTQSRTHLGGQGEKIVFADAKNAGSKPLRALDKRRVGTFVGVTGTEYRTLLVSRAVAGLMAAGELGTGTQDPATLNAIAQAVSRVVPTRAFSAAGLLARMPACQPPCQPASQAANEPPACLLPGGQPSSPLANQ